MSLAYAKSSKEKCAKCFAALHSNTVAVRCNSCHKGLHQKCSTGRKALTCDDQWKCDKCTYLLQNRLAASTNCQVSGSTNSTPSQPQTVTFRNKFKIYKCNADGIHQKFLELRDLLINSDIDLLSVQESKLRKTDMEDSIHGRIHYSLKKSK